MMQEKHRKPNIFFQTFIKPTQRPFQSFYHSPTANSFYSSTEHSLCVAPSHEYANVSVKKVEGALTGAELLSKCALRKRSHFLTVVSQLPLIKNQGRNGVLQGKKQKRM